MKPDIELEPNSDIFSTTEKYVNSTIYCQEGIFHTVSISISCCEQFFKVFNDNTIEFLMFDDKLIIKKDKIISAEKDKE